MYIHKVKVKNFRLLMDIELVLEEDTTLIVGRNNSGKTSLSEVMRRLLTDTSTTFQLEDFSSASYEVKTLTTPRLGSVSWTAVNDYGANVDVTDK